MIPFQNLQATHEPFLKDYFRDLQQIFNACDFIGANSKTLLEFETAFASYIGCKHAIGVASGTDAILLPLDALGVRAGDEVIVPAFGFIATADVVARLGAKPVFVDINIDTFNLDPTLLEAALTEHTKAIIPVHLFGQSCDMETIMAIAEKRGIPVIEDVAQATGSECNGTKLGNIGLAGAFSFYPTKNLGGAGDGGMITTNDDEFARKIRLFRDHGRTPTGEYETIGYNSRLDVIQARYLHYKLDELDDNLADRIENARLYNRLFAESEIATPAVPEDNSHTFNLYTIRVRDRSRLQAFLREKGIATAIYYPITMPQTPALAYLGHAEGEFPKAEDAAKHVISLPIWPGLKKREIEQVVEVVKEFLENNIAMEIRR